MDGSRTKTFWASLGKFGQKSIAPKKIACSCTYGICAFQMMAQMGGAPDGMPDMGDMDDDDIDSDDSGEQF